MAERISKAEEDITALQQKVEKLEETVETLSEKNPRLRG